MNNNLILVLFISFCVIVSSRDVFFGRKPGKMAMHREKVEYNAIPWKKRVTYFYYNDPKQRSIEVSLTYIFFVLYIYYCSSAFVSAPI